MDLPSGNLLQLAIENGPWMIAITLWMISMEQCPGSMWDLSQSWVPNLPNSPVPWLVKKTSFLPAEMLKINTSVLKDEPNVEQILGYGSNLSIFMLIPTTSQHNHLSCTRSLNVNGLAKSPFLMVAP